MDKGDDEMRGWREKKNINCRLMYIAKRRDAVCQSWRELDSTWVVSVVTHTVPGLDLRARWLEGPRRFRQISFSDFQ